MSHTKKETEIEKYKSVKDQIELLRKDIEKLDDAEDWDTVYEQIHKIRERAEYMEKEY